jgi:hypothetical protein
MQPTALAMGELARLTKGRYLMTKVQIAQLADEFDRDAKQFPNYAPWVEVTQTPPYGPLIQQPPRFDPSSMVRDEWEQWDNADRQFDVLAKQLEPLLKTADAVLVDHDEATPNGRVLFWAMGNKYPPKKPPKATMRYGVIPYANAFRHVAVAIRQFLATEPATTNTMTTPSGTEGDESLSNLPDDAMMNHRDLAAVLKLDAEPLRKRLDRWRKRNGDGWQELTEATSKEPRYLYQVRAVREVLREAIGTK